MDALIPINKHSVVYGRKTIDFSLLYCDRKTMEIAVHPDSTVIVKAPVQSDIALIEKKIMKRARWILRQVNYFKQFIPRTTSRCFVTGETHLYLGKQYRLRISEGIDNSVKLCHGIFHIYTKSEPNPTIAKKLLNQWYLEKAIIQFTHSMNRCWPKFSDLGFEKPKLTIKRMQKRWGSLSAKGTITLNTDLIRAPIECIDYVVIHELCHLKFNDHSPEFYNLLGLILQDWENIKHKLEILLS
ncbi:MAG: SprT family zinc-dependent metalloprotease [Marinicella sp.]